MIEINLLPPQYRAVERTPLPIFLTLVGGLLLVAGSLVALAWATRDARKAEELKGNLTAERNEKKKQAQVVDQLEEEIKEAQGRVDTLLNIAESKIYWAQKLEQLVRSLPASVWIDSLSISQKQPGVGEVKLVCNARGTGFNKLAELKQSLRGDTNFFYHFSGIEAPTIEVLATDQKVYAEPEYLRFPSVTLLLRTIEAGPQPQRR
jgi:Tfp pilus assembly protein PilN